MGGVKVSHCGGGKGTRLSSRRPWVESLFGVGRMMAASDGSTESQSPLPFSNVAKEWRHSGALEPTPGVP